MILVTVGTQLPFDRLVAACDEWALRSGHADMFLQIGRSSYRPRHAAWTESLTPEQWDDHMRKARLVVSHAGMGTILSCMEFGKALVVMPRRADLGEHRNDHQLATARRLQENAAVRVVEDAAALHAALTHVHSGAPTRQAGAAERRQLLLGSLRDFVDQPLAGACP